LSQDVPVALLGDWHGMAGAAIARYLAHYGFSLLINGPEDEVFGLQGLSETGKILALPFDVGDEEAVLRVMSSALDLFGRVDVLVNNLSAWADAPLAEITDEHWKQVLEAGFLPSFRLSRAAARVMAAQEYGKIIHVTSTSAYTGQHTPYAAYCAAVHSLTRSLARELAPAVRVNTVAAGLLDEPWIDEGGPDLRQMLVADIPLGRLCRAEDVAEAVAWLAQGADFMTGQMLVLDGGETMR
jgi:NAD(P)-dependent dehydrogenase (short-subunit alcohol dehydrogenase family)